MGLAMTITKSLRSIFRSPCDDYENHQKTSCIPHNPDTSYSLYEEVWNPGRGGLVAGDLLPDSMRGRYRSGDLHGPKHPTQTCQQQLPHQEWLPSSWGLNAVFSGAPVVFKGHVSEWMRVGAAYQQAAALRTQLWSVLFHIRFFSRTKIPWTLKSCGFFCFCFLISRYRRLPALGWHLRDKIAILKAERMQRDKME